MKFNKDGSFGAPTQDCHMGLCEWVANDGKVYVPRNFWTAVVFTTGSQGSAANQRDVLSVMFIFVASSRRSTTRANQQRVCIFRQSYSDQMSITLSISTLRAIWIQYIRERIAM